MLDDNYMPKATSFLVAVNVIAFLVLSLMGSLTDSTFLETHGALSIAAVEEGKWYTLFTSMFMHLDFQHLANNMFVLFFTGACLEQEIGASTFLAIYIGGGLIGNVCSLLQQYQANATVVSLGASGAVFAVIGAMFLLVLLRCGRLAAISKQRMLLMVFLSIYQGYTTVGVNNTAHVAGLCGGIVLGAGYYFTRKYHRDPVEL